MSSDYHGKKPVTDADKKMAKSHLDRTEDLLDDQKDLLKDKIKEHKKAIKNRLKEGNKASVRYNEGHVKGHEHDLADVEKNEAKIHKSMDTLSKLHTHSRRTYNQVRKQSVKLMYRKSGVKNGRTV